MRPQIHALLGATVFCVLCCPARRPKATSHSGAGQELYTQRAAADSTRSAGRRSPRNRFLPARSPLRPEAGLGKKQRDTEDVKDGMFS